MRYGCMMEGRDLDVAVARGLGCRPVRRMLSSGIWSDFECVCQGLKHIDPEAPVGRHLLEYSERIEAAWAMEEEIARQNLWREYGNALADILGTVEPRREGETYTTTNIKAWDLIHASPRNRCLAALKVMGVEL